ncbi:uncharacterized protein LOC121738604 [Aricia agestis]|uniref:uncharacterized protein LOC121738604 n=1 Tax=Aricia agestis TaxID=91739 RepID=UPI001C2078F8|nr:uncharacterized protein LOC121738604 [Aricia agestis]
MQSALDHNASGRVSVDLDEPVEETPLLDMAGEEHSRLKTWASIGVLTLVLLAGILIGIYLLVLQSKAEHIIPDESKVEVVKPKYFDSSDFFSDEYRPSLVVIRAGETHECYEVAECIRVVQDMEDDLFPNGYLSPFHVLAMSDGRFMYDRSWHPGKGDTFIIAMIGNYTEGKLPMMDQVHGISNFIFYHEKLGHFDPKYTIVVETNNWYVLDSFRGNPHFCTQCKPN